uniref:hypothetical protein n=1 Tax=Bosea sp. FBZP-16 TaxID=2065382 RepID=UPI001AECAD87
PSQVGQTLHHSEGTSGGQVIICDPSILILADLQGDLMLETDDGGRCHIRITSIGADHLTFTGRVIERV